jgi:hypothetical protein
MKTIINLLIVIFTFAAPIVHAQHIEERALSNFTKIRTGGSWDVILKKGNRPEVKLEAKNLDLDRVITEVDNGTLNIHLEKGNYRNVDLTVYVTFVELEQIHSGGSGNFKTLSDLVAEDLEINLSGSGDASFKSIEADELHLTMSGSGNVEVKEGGVGKIQLEQSGSGNCKAIGLETEEAEISKSGSGNVALTINQALSVRSSGSGIVEYQGNPEMNDINITGSAGWLKGSRFLR